MKKAKTISDKKPFTYEERILFVFGPKTFTSTEEFTLNHLAKLLQHFCCQRVKIGADIKSPPPQDSLGNWLRQFRFNPVITTYITAMLVNEGFARKVDAHTIEFICRDEKSKRSKMK